MSLEKILLLFSANPKESSIPMRKFYRSMDLDKIKENLRIKRDKSVKNAKFKRELSDKIKNKPLAIKTLSRSQSSSIVRNNIYLLLYVTNYNYFISHVC